MNERYREQVALLIRIMPSVYKIKDFAVHGGTAINLFIKDMPRYSVDIDITYLPLLGRNESFKNINAHLLKLKQMIEKSIPNIKIIHRPVVLKLQCTYNGATVKIEVNGIKRGILGTVEEHFLCEKAQAEFNLGCVARIVPYSQLYGGKIAAALSRQHPRDLFDCKYMACASFDEIKNGLMFSLLGSDKPIIESLQPNPINQEEALKNQFEGMSSTAFNYEDYELARKVLLKNVNTCLTNTDKNFLISFESGIPDWSKCCAGDLSNYPSIKWKRQNIEALRKQNQEKFNRGLEKLSSFLNAELTYL